MPDASETPNPIGRPSLYKPAYCDEVINVCAEGLSLTAFAGEIGVARSTIQEWCTVHPEFSVACKIAVAKRALCLERGMLDPNATGPMVTARRFGLVNATMAGEPKDWTEKLTNEHTGKDGAPIAQSISINWVGASDDDEDSSV